MVERETDILIVGGSTGGCAAAMAAASMGYQVIMTEVSDWIGGQLTSQAVPPDEHSWIEQFGCTRRYRQFRNQVRDYYRRHYPLLPASRNDRTLNPGVALVSRVSHEPRVALAVLEEMLAYHQSAGNLQVWTGYSPVAADTRGDSIEAVTLQHIETGEQVTVQARYILDATEMGDLLPLAGVEYVIGAESADETGEPHAVSGPAQPENVQSFTWCFAMSYDSGGDHTIDKPDQYDRWRDTIPDLSQPWCGPLFSWTHPDPITLQGRSRVLFPWETDNWHNSLWCYRRITCQEHYPIGLMPFEATLVNWPQNDYWDGNIIDKPQDEVARYLDESRQLSLSWLYWMQTEAPRADGGAGYRGLFLRPDLMGTADGLAKQPYIRESRRIRACFTVTELHVGTEARGGGPAAEFQDSVGVGSYRIDLHPSTGGDHYIDISSLPFQIPLGSLIPIRVENLLPACKNLGVTHITNGCYRLHPVEWNIGEAAGLLAAFCLEHSVKSRQVWEQPASLEAFQDLLCKQGIELAWPKIDSR